MKDSEKVIALIPAPIEPTRGIDEDPSKFPDKEHNWVKNENGEIDSFYYDGDSHNGPGCADCGFTFCHHCDRKGYKDKSCLRRQADNRNMRREHQYQEARKIHAIENLYYMKIVAAIEDSYT